MPNFHNLLIQQLGPSNIETIMQVERECWAAEWCVTLDAMNSRFKIFPEGVLGVLNSGDLMGFSTSMILDDLFTNMEPEDYGVYNWNKATNYGYIRNHNPNGQILYIVSVAAKKYGRLLVQAQCDLAIRKKLSKVILCSRVPEFAKYYAYKYNANYKEIKLLVKKCNDINTIANELGINVLKEIQQYIKLKRKDDIQFCEMYGKSLKTPDDMELPLDSLLCFYELCGFSILHLLPHGADGSDPDSFNIGVMLVKNLTVVRCD